MFTLTHDSSDIHVAYGDTRLFTYVVSPDYPQVEFNRPYLHPIHTLAGDVITNERAEDHVWHKGMSMTLTVINDENFWGGKTYVHPEGYVPKDNVGSTLHREWLTQNGGDDVTLAHRLDWMTAHGKRWLNETRTLHCGEVWEGR